MIQIPAAALVRAVQRKHEVALRGILWAASIIGFSHFANAEPVSWPLKKIANNSHLVNQNDKAFLINGDSPQSLMGSLSETDAVKYSRTGNYTE